MIEETKRKRKRKAERKKQETLTKMGKKKGAAGVPASVNKLFGINPGDIIEESGLKCIICHEGYTSSQSKNLLGIYIFMELLDVQTQTMNFSSPAANGLPSLE